MTWYNPNKAHSTWLQTEGWLMQSLYYIVGIVKEEIAVTATIIIIMVLTLLASTAAWPMISSSTIPTAGPIGLGKRNPASCKTSMATSIINAYIKAGKGTHSRIPIIKATSLMGINSE